MKLTFRQLRLIRGLTIQAVANELGVHYMTLRNWELGKKTDLRNLVKLAEFYGVKIEDVKGVMK